jgi:hypothetical protein
MTSPNKAALSTVTVINGETIVHIPHSIIQEFGELEDCEKLSIAVVNDQIVIQRR